MVDTKTLVIETLAKNIRVNPANKTVEVYNEYGVKIVYRDLDEATYNAFVETFSK